MHIRYIVGALLVSSFVARSCAHHRGDRVGPKTCKLSCHNDGRGGRSS